MSTKQIFILCVIICTLCFLTYCTYFDCKYRVFKRRRTFLFFYPFVFYANFLITRDILITIISFLFLFLILYITVVMNSGVGFGTIDILIAPLFSIWFNEHCITFTIVFIFLYFLAGIPAINKRLINIGKDTTNIPMIPLMMVSFLIVLFIVPNSIMFYFSTF